MIKMGYEMRWSDGDSHVRKKETKINMPGVQDVVG